MSRDVYVTAESWLLKKPFVISRSTRVETWTVTVRIEDGEHTGLGEAVASPRYGESNATVMGQIVQQRQALRAGMNRAELQVRMAPGSARNAIDAALWDLESKQSGRHVGELTGLDWPTNIVTVQTISILSPDEMGKEAKRLKDYPVLKVKLNAECVLERLRAVHANAPNARLLVDANESWCIDTLTQLAPQMASLGVVMVEQPLHASADESLVRYDSPIPLYADESCHSRADLPKVENKYAGINIKLDKTGGLTEAIALMGEARRQNYEVMVGCMLGTSLGIAPAMFIASQARYVDIDAPLLLSIDRPNAVEIGRSGRISLPCSCWGGASRTTQSG